MKFLIIIAAAFALSGCNVSTTSAYSVQETYPRVIYSEYSPPVVIQGPVCYMRAMPVYATRQVVSAPQSGNIIAGGAIGAVIGSELADNNRALGAFAGAIIGGSIANQPSVTTERVVIGSTQERFCE
jgi:uncharacterized protein YcfJ